MSNHLHLLLEVPPGCEKGETLDFSDGKLIHRRGGLYSRNHTRLEARELEVAGGLRWPIEPWCERSLLFTPRDSGNEGEPVPIRG